MGNEIQPLKMSGDKNHDLDNHWKSITYVTLYEVDKTKYIGIMISNDLTLSPQVEYFTSSTELRYTQTRYTDSRFCWDLWDLIIMKRHNIQETCKTSLDPHKVPGDFIKIKDGL